MLSKTVKRLKEWYKGYDEAPAWFRFCSLVFAVSALAFIVVLFGPAILGGNIIGFWVYQNWALTFAGFPYIVIIVVTFMLAVISGIPTLRYQFKKMRKLKESNENEADL